MLYDKRWEKTDDLSLQSLIAWLERQPARGTYEFSNGWDCLLAQWLRSMDEKSSPDMFEDSYGYIFKGEPVNVRRFRPIAEASDSNPKYFGDALRMARRMADCG